MNTLCEQRLGFRRESMMAVVLSVLAHIGVAALLYTVTSHADLSRIDSDPRIIHVTWVHPSEVSDIQTASSQIDTGERNADSRIDRLHHPKTERKVPETQPVEPRRNETTEDQNRRDDTGISAVSVALHSPTRMAGQANTQIVALTHGLKTYDQSAHEKGAVIAKPRYGENTRPHYPFGARLKGHEGVVLISAEILAEGRVGNIKIKSTSGHDNLDRSALEAVKNWKFEPGKKMGKPITMWVDIPVRYVLSKNN